MIKKTGFVFLLFLVCLNVIFSQEVKTPTLFSDGYSWVANENAPSILYNASNLSGLYSMNIQPHFTSVKTQSTKTFFSNKYTSVNHHPLVFAKINFFGIKNLDKHDDIETPFKEDDSSFWDNEIIYFAIGAVAATALYIVWQNSGSENPPQKTFGLPPKPQGAYGL